MARLVVSVLMRDSRLNPMKNFLEGLAVTATLLALAYLAMWAL